jgi:MFS family permease
VLGTFGAGFAVRPLGAAIFGSLGDRFGRKRTFVTTMLLMGLATAAIGILPTYESAGLLASVLLVGCRLLQGFALGGEYGGAAIFVAEHAPAARRGLHTSWIQVSAAIGFLLSLGVTIGVHQLVGTSAWNDWGWRIPFLLAVPMLSVSVYGRLRLHESPIFEQIKRSSSASRAPVRESLSNPGNLRRILVGLFGIAAGQTVIWFTAQFSTLYLLQREGGLEDATALSLMAIATLIACPAFVLSGWLSDRIGRKRTLVGAYALGLLLIVPAFKILPGLANPERAQAARNAPVVVTGADCDQPVFSSAPSTPCTVVLGYLRDHGIPYTLSSGAASEAGIAMGARQFSGFDPQEYEAALREAGYLQVSRLTTWRAVAIAAIVVVLVAVVGGAYGPNAAILVELFPARIRYTSLSIAYHIGTGFFGGFQPFITQYIAIKAGNAIAGLVYPMTILAVALVICAIALPDMRGRDIRD